MGAIVEFAVLKQQGGLSCHVVHSRIIERLVSLKIAVAFQKLISVYPYVHHGIDAIRGFTIENIGKFRIRLPEDLPYTVYGYVQTVSRSVALRVGPKKVHQSLFRHGSVTVRHK